MYLCPSSPHHDPQVRCYLRLSDNTRACEALCQCLPDQLKDETFAVCLKVRWKVDSQKWFSMSCSGWQEHQALAGSAAQEHRDDGDRGGGCWGRSAEPQGGAGNQAGPARGVRPLERTKLRAVIIMKDTKWSWANNYMCTVQDSLELTVIWIWSSCPWFSGRGGWPKQLSKKYLKTINQYSFLSMIPPDQIHSWLEPSPDHAEGWFVLQISFVVFN